MVLKLFRHARIHTPRMGGRPAAGKEQGKLDVLEDGAFLVENGRFLAVGTMPDLEEHLERRSPDLTRSEERRVGKECRSRWSPYH